MTSTFARTFPNLARWVTSHGWIEPGDDGASPSFVRVLDEGGMIYEGMDSEASADGALQEAESAVSAWFEENPGA